MATKLSQEQCFADIERKAGEWLDKDLEKGSVLPLRHWPLGRCRRVLSFLLWRNGIVPLIFTVYLIGCMAEGAWSLLAVSALCYIAYWMLAVLVNRRENVNFIFKKEGLTIVTSRRKVYIPWEAIEKISSKSDRAAVVSVRPVSRLLRGFRNVGCGLTIQTKNHNYRFYEAYSMKLVTDSDGRVDPAMIQLDVAGKLLQAVVEKNKGR